MLLSSILNVFIEGRVYQVDASTDMWQGKHAHTHAHSKQTRTHTDTHTQKHTYTETLTGSLDEVSLVLVCRKWSREHSGETKKRKGRFYYIIFLPTVGACAKRPEDPPPPGDLNTKCFNLI